MLPDQPAHVGIVNSDGSNHHPARVLDVDRYGLR
jgi:hypothetical protein